MVSESWIEKAGRKPGSVFTEPLICANKDLFDWGFGYLEVDFLGKDEHESAEVAFRLEYDLEFWSKPYSLSDLATAIEETLTSEHSSFTYWQKDENTTIHGFGVSITMPRSCTVREALDHETRLKELVALIRGRLDDRSGAAVTLAFDFPPAVKSACEQYLMYFVQFLSDLGIEADAEIKENASRVLFSVAPIDEKEALEKIREALQIYLGLPVSTDLPAAAAQFHDVAVAQLQANVLHLQSQITLAKAAMQMKNATIGAQRTHIGLLQDTIDIRAFQPQTPAEKTESDKEELVKGLVSVKKWDYKFVEVDVPELLRRLKRRL